ncbi:MAG: hypothetical protein ACW963_08935 [Candidatus Sifarchaeia archaeon]
MPGKERDTKVCQLQRLVRHLFYFQSNSLFAQKGAIATSNKLRLGCLPIETQLSAQHVCVHDQVNTSVLPTQQMRGQSIIHGEESTLGCISYASKLAISLAQSPCRL